MERKRKKSPIIFFAGVFIIVVIVTLVVNHKEGLTYEVRFPLNGGVSYLSSVADNLAAACHDAKVYVWNWNQLSAKPAVIEAQSDQAVLLKTNQVASVRSSNAREIVVEGLDSAKEHKNIPVAANGKLARLAVSPDGQTVVVMLADSGGSNQEIALVDCNAGLVRSITKLAAASGDRIMGLAVSNGGGLVALAGEKSGQGYMALVGIEQNSVLWARQMPDLQKIRNAVFSKDDKVIYIRGTDSTVQVIDVRTGEVLKKLLPLKENTSTAGDQHVQTLAISDDGRLLAASIASTVYVWDVVREKVILVKSPGHKLVSGLAFSPDSKYLATSDSRQGGTIKIWRIPKH
jgi:WD40 repeat protein